MRPAGLGPSQYVANLKSWCRYCGKRPPLDGLHYCQICEPLARGAGPRER
jgi:hypothetical protein